MSSKHRFDRDEISRILKRAVELEHNDNTSDNEREGLTLEELQQVSREVGIDPKYVKLAIGEMKEPVQSPVANLLGGPFKYNITQMAEGVLTDEEWEEVVSEIRRIHGGIGNTSKLGKTFEWEQRKQEVGYIQIALSPKKETTKIHINVNYRQYATLVYVFSGIFGITLSGILFDGSSLSNLTQFLIGTSGMLTLFTGARFYLSNWMKKKHDIYTNLIRRFREMLGSEPDTQTEHEPSIAMPDSEETPETHTQTGTKGRTKN